MKVNFDKAEEYLVQSDEETDFPVHKQVLAIYNQSKINDTMMIDHVDGVQTVEQFEYTFTCRDFLEHIGNKLANLKLAIDEESVNIYVDNGDDQEPTHIVYWHIDEFEEDGSVCISALNALQLFYTNPQELLDRLKIQL